MFNVLPVISPLYAFVKSIVPFSTTKTFDWLASTKRDVFVAGLGSDVNTEVGNNEILANSTVDAVSVYTVSSGLF